MRGDHVMSTDRNAWVLGGYIRFSLSLNKQVCYIPFTRLLMSMSLTSLLLHPPSQKTLGPSYTGIYLFPNPSTVYNSMEIFGKYVQLNISHISMKWFKFRVASWLKSKTLTREASNFSTVSDSVQAPESGHVSLRENWIRQRAFPQACPFSVICVRVISNNY